MSGDLSKPGNAVNYALGLVGEEGTEIGQLGYKISRFGVLGQNPALPDNNLELMQKELTDLVATVRVANFELAKHGLPLLILSDEPNIARKIDKVAYYAQVSMDEGLLSEPLAIMS